MKTRSAEAQWKGNLREGKGNMSLGSGAFEGSYSFASRFEEASGTNPEELIGAAHAGCFSMALASGLTKAGYDPKHIRTKALVTLDKVEGKSTITRIELFTEAEIPGIDDATFHQQADAAKEGCPVSRALAGVQITLDAKLLQGIIIAE